MKLLSIALYQNENDLLLSTSTRDGATTAVRNQKYKYLQNVNIFQEINAIFLDFNVLFNAEVLNLFCVMDPFASQVQ